MLDIGISVRGFSKGYTTNYVQFDELKDGKFKRVYDKQLAKEFTQAQMKAIAEDILKDINRNLAKGLRYKDGQKVKPLAPSTIKAKKAKGRSNPSRVFVDSGKLIGSAYIKKQGGLFLITFKNNKYPKSDATVPEVAKWLNEGTDRMPSRPFFGVTKKRLQELIDKHIMSKKTRRPSKATILRDTRGVQ